MVESRWGECQGSGSEPGGQHPSAEMGTAARALPQPPMLPQDSPSLLSRAFSAFGTSWPGFFSVWMGAL